MKAFTPEQTMGKLREVLRHRNHTYSTSSNDEGQI